MVKPKQLKTYRLMIKTHRVTGLCYLCVSSRSDFEIYTGSGRKWREHLRHYGKDISTEVLFETESRDEVGYVGEHFSRMWDVKVSSDWANVLHEQGYNKPDDMILGNPLSIKIDGIIYNSKKEAREALGIGYKAFYRARKWGRTEYKLSDFDNLDRLKVMRHPIIDGIEYKSIKGACRLLCLDFVTVHRFIQQNHRSDCSYNLFELSQNGQRVGNQVVFDEVQYLSVSKVAEAFGLCNSKLGAYIRLGNKPYTMSAFNDYIAQLGTNFRSPTVYSLVISGHLYKDVMAVSLKFGIPKSTLYRFFSENRKNSYSTSEIANLVSKSGKPFFVDGIQFRSIAHAANTHGVDQNKLSKYHRIHKASGYSSQDLQQLK